MQAIKVRISKEVLTPSNTQNFEGVLASSTFSFAGNDFALNAPLVWNVNVVNGGEGYLFVTGNIAGRLNTKCVRCLENASVDIDSEVEGYVKIKSDAKLPSDVGEDECVALENGKFIDLAPFLEGAVMLDLPIQPLCSENCEGLFEYCDNCADDKEDVQHPFEVLKNFNFD